VPPRKRAPKVVAEDKRSHFGDPGEPLATSPGIKTYPLIRQLGFKKIGDDFPHIIRSPCSRLDKFRDIQHVVVYTVVRLGTFKMGPGADGNGTHKARGWCFQ